MCKYLKSGDPDWPPEASPCVVCVIWPSVLALLSEAGSCANYGRPSQTTGKNQHEALTVTTTQRRPDSETPTTQYFSLSTSVLKGCLEWRLHFNVRTQQLSSHASEPLDSSHWERRWPPTTTWFCHVHHLFWRETFTVPQVFFFGFFGVFFFYEHRGRKSSFVTHGLKMTSWWEINRVYKIGHLPFSNESLRHKQLHSNPPVVMFPTLACVHYFI